VKVSGGEGGDGRRAGGEDRGEHEEDAHRVTLVAGAKYFMLQSPATQGPTAQFPLTA
jgi:hypothetical protein